MQIDVKRPSIIFAHAHKIPSATPGGMDCFNIREEAGKLAQKFRVGPEFSCGVRVRMHKAGWFITVCMYIHTTIVVAHILLEVIGTSRHVIVELAPPVG